MLTFDIITLFPEAFNLHYSILGRAIEQQKIVVNLHNLRDFGFGKRQTVDDRPFGGGAGMVMAVAPIYKCLKRLGVYPTHDNKTKVLLTSARGQTWNQDSAQNHSQLERIVIICGHYEGIDQRVADHLVDEEVSIGNYVLTGGEIAAKVIVDSTARLVPGVVGNPESLEEESFQNENNDDKEYPQYTRPEAFETEEGNSWQVPQVLLSGNHQEIANWRERNTKISHN